MHTNNIKSFAKKARLMLLEGVAQRLKYWGFDDHGKCSLSVESTAGGYTIRGQVFTDPEVPAKWNRLKKRLTNKQAVDDVIEEAAYTWFNRLMAIKILESNGYTSPQLTYSSGTRTPIMVQEAKRGNHNLKRPQFINLLNEFLRDSREEQALGLLITRLCNNNKTLHDVFGRIDDYTELLLPQNLLQKDGLMDLINADIISVEDYKQVELIGWLYQFYISDKKDKVFADFKKKKKARAEDIPAATQIFTPKWIVSYMVENTVGKLYLDYEPTSTLKQQMKYLVENEEDNDAKPIISDIKELTLLDPASGSGHILVTGFDLLFKMYREEGYTSRQAVENILKYNLWGLDIDDRAMQLARFAVLLKAAEYDAEILNRGIIPHIYSFPEQEDFGSEDINIFLGVDGYQYTLELITALDLLKQGKNIGSALKLDLSKRARDYIQGQYDRWTVQDVGASLEFEKQILWQRIKPYMEVLLVLTGKYASVVANPPYMHRKNMNTILRDYVFAQYLFSKTDLFAVFFEKSYDFIIDGGHVGIINQQSWMFISSYEELRYKLLKNTKIVSLLHLGLGVFKELNTKVVQSVAITGKKNNDNWGDSIFFDLRRGKDLSSKEKMFLNKENKFIQKQKMFLEIPGSPIAYWINQVGIKIFKNKKISDHSDIFQGMITGDNSNFVRLWYEPDYNKLSLGNEKYVKGSYKNKYWCPYNKGGDSIKWYGNQYYIVNFKHEGQDFTRGKHQFSHLFFKEYITWTYISLSLVSRYFPKGFLWDVAGSGLFPKDVNNILYITPLLTSKVGNYLLEILNPTLNFQVENIASVPLIFPDKYTFDKICLITSDAIERTKERSLYEISWDFKRSPLLNDSQSLKQSYSKWFQDVTHDFFQLHANEEELNRIFIDIYGLQNELNPHVPLKDITILQDELNTNALKQLEPIFRQYGKEAIELPIKKEEMMAQFLSYCIGLMLGRYRLDKPGLNIAHPNPSEQELSNYTHNGQVIHIDEDAIIPLMGKECRFADDALMQVKHILHAVWGENTLTENINFLQECLGMNLHDWITQKFWSYHTRMYKKKPIYWMFCSNPNQPRKSAFRVLTYIHRMDRFTVQRIQRNYLHPHQEYIKREIDKLKENEGSLGRQEVKRFEMLQAWGSECRDYNEVLKELANQQIEFDLDDGVTVNYAMFEEAVAKI